MESPLVRLPVESIARNGLHCVRGVMADRLIAVPKSKVGARVGQLHDQDIQRLNRALLVFLGLAASPRTRRGREPMPKRRYEFGGDDFYKL
jgi:mRNA interferase MazF